MQHVSKYRPKLHSGKWSCGVVAVSAPVIIGILLGSAALGGALAGATASGVLMALFMANAGGAWDNAKKAIEQGHRWSVKR